MALGISRLTAIAAAASALWLPSISHAAFPDKTITIVYGFPGGNDDVLARICADGLTRQLGATVVAEVKTGAGGTIAVRVPSA